MLQAGSSREQDTMSRMNFFSIYLILPAAFVQGVYSVSNRNACQKQKKLFFWRVKRGRYLELTILLPSVSQSHSVGSLRYNNPIGLRDLLRGELYFCFGCFYLLAVSLLAKERLLDDGRMDRNMQLNI
jgi:hypothetical protein